MRFQMCCFFQAQLKIIKASHEFLHVCTLRSENSINDTESNVNIISSILRSRKIRCVFRSEGYMQVCCQFICKSIEKKVEKIIVMKVGRVHLIFIYTIFIRDFEVLDFFIKLYQKFSRSRLVLFSCWGSECKIKK